MIITQTPLRIGLLGGGTDLPDYYREHGGRDPNCAIDRAEDWEAKLRRRWFIVGYCRLYSCQSDQSFCQQAVSPLPA